MCSNPNSFFSRPHFLAQQTVLYLDKFYKTAPRPVLLIMDAGNLNEVKTSLEFITACF